MSDSPKVTFVLFLSVIMCLFVTKKLVDASETDGDIGSLEFDETIYEPGAPVPQSVFRRPSRQRTTWPRGEVNYRLHPSFAQNPNYVKLFQEVIQEFETKTCIRFIETDNATSFVNVKIDNSVNCAKSDVCMKPGERYLRITENCLTFSKLVHELGHTLCLSHEQWRHDRDNYLWMDGCTEDEKHIPKPYLNISLYNFYDYASVMHHWCPCANLSSPVTKFANWTLCPGPEVVRGPDQLSVIDADTINTLYDCNGCHRHRWIPKEKVTSVDHKNMYSFGTRISGFSFTPGRNLYDGEVVAGEFYPPDFFKGRSRYAGMTLVQMGAVTPELLSISGGFKGSNENGGGDYMIVDSDAYSREDLLKWAVPAGNGWSINGRRLGTSYVAFSRSITLQEKSLKENIVTFPERGNEERIPMVLALYSIMLTKPTEIASVWDWGYRLPERTAFTDEIGRNITFKFKILICKK